MIRDPDRKSYVADCLSVSQASCWDDVVITPAVVRKYIEDVIKRGKHLKKGAICFRGPKAWSPRGVDPGRFRTK